MEGLRTWPLEGLRTRVKEDERLGTLDCGIVKALGASGVEEYDDEEMLSHGCSAPWKLCAPAPLVLKDPCRLKDPSRLTMSSRRIERSRLTELARDMLRLCRR